MMTTQTWVNIDSGRDNFNPQSTGMSQQGATAGPGIVG